MSSILDANLSANARSVQLEKFVFSEFKCIDTVKADPIKKEIFEDFNKIDTPKLVLEVETSVAETLDSSHSENDDFYIYENYLSQTSESESKKLVDSKKNKMEEFVDTESESNVVYRTKVNLGRNKTINLIVKDILKDDKSKFFDEKNQVVKINPKKIVKNDDFVCRVGQKDEIIKYENIIPVESQYLF